MGRHALSQGAHKRKLSREREKSYQAAEVAYQKALTDASLRKEGLKVPPKPRVATRKEVWALVDGDNEVEEVEEEDLHHYTSPESSSTDDNDEEEEDNE